MNISGIEVGDYFITRHGDVGQVLSFGAATNTLNSDIGLIFKAEITEFSSDLHDLIKGGDYLNGTRISQSKDGYLSYNGASIKGADIRQFMTAKKFYKNCYTPGQNNETIRWKTCVGFPKYEVSDTGRVRAKASGKYMSLLRDRIYWSVRIEDKSGHRLRKSVAVLVLEAFDSAANGRMPMFIDGDPENCSLSNLTWETKSEQARRVLPKLSPGKASNFTYKYIVGYMLNKPIIYGTQSRDILNKLQTYHEDFANTQATHLVRTIKEQKTYHGIEFKCLSKEKYQEEIRKVNLDDFYLLYNDLKTKSKPKAKKVSQKREKISSDVSVVKENKVSQTSQKVVKTEPKVDKIIKEAKLTSNSINDIDDSEFFKEQKRLEEERRQKFKDELMRRMKQ